MDKVQRKHDLVLEGDGFTEEHKNNEHETAAMEKQMPESHLKEPINRSRNVREKVQTWIVGVVTEVKRKSPSMVNRWVSGERADAEQKEQEPQKLGKIEEQAEFTAEGLRSTIKSKLQLNGLYDRISRTRDITGLFHRNKNTMERQQSQEERIQRTEQEQEDDSTDDEGAKDLHVARFSGGTSERYVVRDLSESDGGTHRPLGHASSPNHSHHEEFQFSFEDFSFIEGKTPKGGQLASTRESQKGNSGCAEQSKENSDAPIKPRRLNIGEIGRSSSASHHPDSGIELGIKGSTKRHLLSDIGRRFSEMNESSDCCEFRSESLQQDGSNRSLNQLRPNSMPVSPKPRMLLPAQHRGSTDFSSNKQRSSSLLREYSTQSDSSRCSSVESLLESRKPDAETILINLGFGPVQSDDVLSRLPKRFLKPSQVSGIDTEDFLKQQQLATTLHDHSCLGYRGLVDPVKLRILKRFGPHK